MNPSHCRNWYCVPKTPIRAYIQTHFFHELPASVKTLAINVPSKSLIAGQILLLFSSKSCCVTLQQSLLHQWAEQRVPFLLCMAQISNFFKLGKARAQPTTNHLTLDNFCFSINSIKVLQTVPMHARAHNIHGFCSRHGYIPTKKNKLLFFCSHKIPNNT